MVVKIVDLQDVVRNTVERREIKHNPFLAIIVSVHGSIYVDNRPSLVWISESNQPESRHIAFAGNITPVEDLPVWVQKSPKPPHALEIIDVYTSGMDYSNEIAPFQVPIHGVNHQYPSELNPGIDLVLTYQPAIQPLKTTGNGADLTVYTEPCIYVFGGVRYVFGGYFSDMTSYLPAAGNIVRVLIYLDPSTNALGYLSGSEVAIGNPVPYPDVPTNTAPSAYILLEDGQTEIETSSSVEDTRDLFSAGGGGASAAEQIGQILYSTDGVVFTPELPVVNDEGIMLTTEGYILVL